MAALGCSGLVAQCVLAQSIGPNDNAGRRQNQMPFQQQITSSCYLRPLPLVGQVNQNQSLG